MMKDNNGDKVRMTTRELNGIPNATQPFNFVRMERDRRLGDCDWIVLRSIETGEPIPKDWSEYRQALRDFPLNPDKEWPNEPR